MITKESLQKRVEELEEKRMQLIQHVHIFDGAIQNTKDLLQQFEEKVEEKVEVVKKGKEKT